MNGNYEGEYNISLERMEKLVNISNNTPYNATDKAPNKMNDTHINNLIKKK
jgi:plasmid replication initiation protein